jgi:predicted transposase YdaD
VESVRQARAAIEAQPGLTEGQLADRLAVLSFIAEAEGVPVQALRHYIPKEELMASTLYQEILAEGRADGETKGEARGVTKGETKIMKDTVLRVLNSRLGEVEPRIREQVQALDSGETLKQWYEEALEAVNAQSARKLAQKITQATLS